MRVLVCGGRDYASTSMCERNHVHGSLTDLHRKVGPFSVVIHGCATGADQEGRAWAQMMGLKEAPFRADWNAHGRAAGPVRNQRMLTEGKPDLVVAFPGGKGTADMVRRAKSAGVQVVEPGA